METFTTSMLLLFLSLRLVMVMNQGLEVSLPRKLSHGALLDVTEDPPTSLEPSRISETTNWRHRGRNRAESPRCTTISLSVTVEWSSTALRKQRRPRPFTNSPEIRSCLNLVGSGIDPRQPLLPLSELYLDGTATAGEAGRSLLPSHAGLSSGPSNGTQRISVLTGDSEIR
ncbi:hypothetical protein Bca4012_077151 [Brassica carinata]